MKRIKIQELWYAVEIKIWEDFDAYSGHWKSLKTYVYKPYISDEECQQTIKEYLPEFNKDVLENKNSKGLYTKHCWQAVEEKNYTLLPYFYWETVDTVENGSREELKQRWKSWD